MEKQGSDRWVLRRASITLLNEKHVEMRMLNIAGKAEKTADLMQTRDKTYFITWIGTTYQ